jgi:hypothetical protein
MVADLYEVRLTSYLRWYAAWPTPPPCKSALRTVLYLTLPGGKLRLDRFNKTTCMDQTRLDYYHLSRPEKSSRGSG